MGEGHLPVLVDEVLTSLAVGAGSSVADCTVGGGGHAERLLETTSPDGRLLGIDADRAAIAEAKRVLARFGDRVVLHGHVSEEFKAELYARSWLNLTASSAEGWCLTVMEAATCGTPSVALRVGGLPESIVDGETGLLAEDHDDLVAQTTRLVEDERLRERLGAGALARAQEFSWERTADRMLTLLQRVRSQEAAAPARRRRARGGVVARTCADPIAGA